MLPIRFKTIHPSTTNIGYIRCVLLKKFRSPGIYCKIYHGANKTEIPNILNSFQTLQIYYASNIIETYIFCSYSVILNTVMVISLRYIFEQITDLKMCCTKVLITYKLNNKNAVCRYFRKIFWKLLWLFSFRGNASHPKLHFQD